MSFIWTLEHLPYLEAGEFIDFKISDSHLDVVAVGGQLSPGLLLSAYQQSIFPWYNEGEPVHWWSPDPRFVLFLNELHISKSLKKLMRQKFSVLQNSESTLREGSLRFSLDEAFESVIYGCAHTSRQPSGNKEDSATWITNAMQAAYIQLHQLGYAHSAECWLMQANGSEKLVGGLYGLGFGLCFYGESMFSLLPNASKLTFAIFALFLRSKYFQIIDCQQESKYLGSFGARAISRKDFLQILPTNSSIWQHNRGNWGVLWPDYPKIGSEWPHINPI